MRTIKILLTSLLLMLLAAPGVVQAGIAVKPANVVLPLDTGRPSGRFVVANNGDTEERFRINATHFAYSPNGALQVVAPDGRSLAPWVKFNPKEFVLPPNSKRAVRFVIVPRGTLSPGEYWGAMELESLDYKETTTHDKDGRQITVKVIPSVLVPIYGTVGEVQYQATIEGINIIESTEGPALSVRFANVGGGRLMMKGSFTIVDTENRTLFSGKLPSGLILPGNHRYFNSLLEGTLESGDYKLSIDYGARTMGDERITEEFAFRID